jgi:YfiH family protein
MQRPNNSLDNDGGDNPRLPEDTMFTKLLTYDLGEKVEAFSTRRNSVLPYPVIQGHQVHGDNIAVIDRPGYTREDLEGYDAFVTALPGVAIGARTADCVPVLLHDPVRRVVAAVHAGWKGTVLQIVPKAVNVMEQQFGCKAADLNAVIGPAIGPDSFQVGEEVVARFKDSGFPMERIWSFRGTGDGTPMSGGHHVDLFEANRWLLEEAGVPSGNVQVFGIDTYTDGSFFSARREGIQCGRNINSIKLSLNSCL